MNPKVRYGIEYLILPLIVWWWDLFDSTGDAGTGVIALYFTYAEVVHAICTHLPRYQAYIQIILRAVIAVILWLRVPITHIDPLVLIIGATLFTVVDIRRVEKCELMRSVGEEPDLDDI